MSSDLKELIARDVELFKNVDTTPPKLDAIELTLILKAAGYRLESLDFGVEKSERNPDQMVHVDIQCHRSGIVSRLVYKPEQCSCPGVEAALNTSFWEVQASNPGGSKEILDSSSNLLPDITAASQEFSNTMLQFVLAKFNEDKSSKDAAIWKSKRQPQLNSPATGVGTQLVTSTASSSSASDDVTIISNGGSDHLSPATAVAATMTETFHTPLSSINVTPMKSEDIAAVAVGVPKVLLIDVNGNKSTTPNFELGHFSSPTADMFTSSPNNEDVFAMSPENRATFAKNLRETRDRINVMLGQLDARAGSNSSVINDLPAKLNKLTIKPDQRRHSISALSQLKGPVANVKKITPLKSLQQRSLVESKRRIAGSSSSTLTTTTTTTTTTTIPRTSLSGMVGRSGPSSLPLSTNGQKLGGPSKSLGASAKVASIRPSMATSKLTKK